MTEQRKSDESYEEMRQLIEEFNKRIDLIQDDELKNVLVILKDLILLGTITSYYSSSEEISAMDDVMRKRINKLHKIIKQDKDFRDKYF